MDLKPVGASLRKAVAPELRKLRDAVGVQGGVMPYYNNRQAERDEAIDAAFEAGRRAGLADRGGRVMDGNDEAHLQGYNDGYAAGRKAGLAEQAAEIELLKAWMASDERAKIFAEQAAEIEALRAEIEALKRELEKLREALGEAVAVLGRQFASVKPQPDNPAWKNAAKMHERWRAALTGGE